MADLYVRSTDGSDADNGSTWALAKATISGAAAIDAAGDRIYVSQSHAVTGLGAQTIALAGTAAAPVWLICANDGAEPPTAVATGASESTTGAASYTITGYGYIRGISFSIGSGANNVSFFAGSNALQAQTYKLCSITLATTGTSATIGFSGSAVSTSTRFDVEDCTLTLANNAGQGISFGNCILRISGGSVSGPTSYTTGLFTPSTNRGFYCLVSGVDISGVGSGTHLCRGGAVTSPGVLIIRNCKLPASWSGSLVASQITAPGLRVEMHNCDSGDTNYRIQVADYAGSLIQETTIVRTGGASDGTTTLSWKLVTSADAEYPSQVFNTPEIVRWNETTGSSITVTVETITDNVTLKDDECWLEVQYLGTSGVPLGSFVNDAKADVLATAANQTTSTETWTTTGLTTPVKQKLSVSFTPQEKGFIHAVVNLAKASTTVYVDPKLTVT